MSREAVLGGTIFTVADDANPATVGGDDQWVVCADDGLGRTRPIRRTPAEGHVHYLTYRSKRGAATSALNVRSAGIAAYPWRKS